MVTFYRRKRIEQNHSLHVPTLERLTKAQRVLVEGIIEQTSSPDSVPMWVRALKGLGHQAVRAALAALRAEQLQRAAGGQCRAIKDAGAWLTTKLIAMAEDR